MAYPFYKYQGTGNDFVIIDNRQDEFPKNNTKLVAQMCNRKFGIGADGLLLLEKHPTAHFSMVYYNSDGQPSSMCGNGGRCLVHFARELGVINDSATFEAVDGLHQASIKGDEVSLEMQDVNHIIVNDTGVFLNTGSPHHVQEVSNLKTHAVYTEGQRIRNELYGTEGANINFVEPMATDIFAVRTYERGVENETLSCGTGVTAVAIAMHQLGKTNKSSIQLQTPGGNLQVSFNEDKGVYTHVYLTGPAVQVFKGSWE